MEKMFSCENLKSRISILSLTTLLVVLGAFHTKPTWGRVIGVEDNDVEADNADALRPYVTSGQQKRMCTELCMSGLGGDACGAECADLVPSTLPYQYINANATVSYGRVTRHGVCEVLCNNKLGWPLCQCPKQGDQGFMEKRPDFVEVCSTYCLKYNYRIYGCQKCSVYNSTAKSFGDFSSQSLKLTSDSASVDWDAWCQNMCQNGDGGAACYCDLLPMSMNIK